MFGFNPLFVEAAILSDLVVLGLGGVRRFQSSLR